MTIPLQQRSDGVLLPIQAQPGARRKGVVGEHDGRLKVAISQAPEKGKANKGILRLLAAEFGLSKSQVALVSGESNSRKVVLLAGITLPAAQARVAELLSAAGK
jgi:uncharacterized protein (TIGR00251 family)